MKLHNNIEVTELVLEQSIVDIISEIPGVVGFSSPVALKNSF